MDKDVIFARTSVDGLRTQDLDAHLLNVGEICSDFCAKFPLIATLLGYAHDLGKSCNAFQNKLLNNSSERVDHSSASAIFLLKKFEEVLKNHSRLGKSTSNYLLVLEICAFVSACHHKGLVDMVNHSESVFSILLNKLNDASFAQNYNEILSKGHKYCENIEKILNKTEFVTECDNLVSSIQHNHCAENGVKNLSFYIGMYLRYFYSCLIDADRIDAGNFDNNKKYIKNEEKDFNIRKNFEKIAKKLDEIIESFPSNEINLIRKEIYKTCIEKAKLDENLFNLNVQTGGGKTFASFRFALERAKLKNLNRIIYVVPYISIIEQNADVIRKILNSIELNDMIIESHSNVLRQEKEVDEYKINKFDAYFTTWNEPIIFTTMVGFLESVYGDSSQNNRRLHNFENSIIIFDEIQSLPINCIGLFNLLIKFLIKDLNCTVVLCSATQPVLDELSNYRSDDIAKFLELPKSYSLIDKEYPILRRTQIIRADNVIMNKTQAVKFALDKLKSHNNLLFVVNTKKAAKELFLEIKKHTKCYHLSTNMCPQHRLDVINQVRENLIRKEKFMLISTQLIEAGVDLDFECAIRSLSGLESIIQTAGRCNREGKLQNSDGTRCLGQVYVVRLDKDLENLRGLPDIAVRQNHFVNVLSGAQGNFDSKELIEKYFKSLYGGESNNQKEFPISSENSNAVDLLIQAQENVTPQYFNLLKIQFGTVATNFRVIANQNQTGILVPYGMGQEIIDDLVKSGTIHTKSFQRYMVNIYDNDFTEFNCKNESGLMFSLNYDKDLGLVRNEDFYIEFEGGICN